MTTDIHRLPVAVVPELYELTIRTDLAEKQFSGSLIASLRVDEDTSIIVFNANEMLDITHVAFAVANDAYTPLELTSVTKDAANERVTLTMPNKLTAGSYLKLQLRWNARFVPGLRGYFLSLSGAKPCAVTKFEPGSARCAFPCWDEPSFKARFSITHYTKEDDCISNMPLKEHEVIDGYRVHRFAESPLMSTYLVAWMVGPLQTLESSIGSVSGEQITLRVICPAGHEVKDGEYTLRLMEKVIPMYEMLFNVPYLLPKLDMLAVDDYESYAMENWGLIIGRPERLLVNPETMSLQDRKDAAGTIMHEISHMWFGDAVSFSWWDQLWLSEAFATLVGELIIPNRVYPEWNLPQEFLVNHLRSGLALDSRRGSHPVEVHCPSVKDISQYYDDISYSKGAAILRMLSAVVGEDVFIKGTSTYLKSHLYGNAETQDLWKAISTHTSIDVVALMDSWTSKTGYPVVFVREEGDKVHVSQKRFFATGVDDEQTLWVIPLEIKVLSRGNAQVKHVYLAERRATFELGQNEGFKLNAGTNGFYRVAYEPARLKALAAANLSVEDRIGIVSDSWALARAGIYAVTDVLHMLTSFRNETNPHVWTTIHAGLDKMADVWWAEPEEVRQAIRSFTCNLLALVAHGKFTGSDYQIAAIKSCARAGDATVIDRLLAMFDSEAPSDLQDVVFETAVKNGKYDDVRKIFETSCSTTRNNALRALGAAPTKETQDRTFAMITDGTAKDQEVVDIFIFLSSNHSCRHRLAMYFKDNFETLSKRFSNNFGFGQLITHAFDSLTSPSDLADVKNFFESHDVSNYTAKVQQVLDFMRASVEWLERDRVAVEEWAATILR